MSNILDKVKEELKKKKEELEKSKQENYAKNYYKDIATSSRGNQMIVVITDDINYRYVSRGAIDDSYDLVASMITGIKKEEVESNKTIEDLSRDYNYVIITAEPTINNDPTSIYIPETLAEFQERELSNFLKQVEEFNNKYDNKVIIKKIDVNKPEKSVITEDNESILK